MTKANRDGHRENTRGAARRPLLTVRLFLVTQALLVATSLLLTAPAARAEWLSPAPSAPAPQTTVPEPSNPSSSTESFRPPISIPVPGLTFSTIKAKSDTGYIDVPWLAEYVNAAYRYAVTIASIVAAVMFMVGGFQYLTAGGDKGRVDAGKKRITDALVGLLLLLGANALLRTVNSGLVSLTVLRVQTVPPKQFERISAQNMIAATGHAALPSGKMIGLAMKVAREKIPGDDFACFIYASMQEESGGRQDALGHDENAATDVFSVGARRQFINSGKMYSGATFPAAGCNDKSCQKQGPSVNDDIGTFDVTKPPDYGLDWRFSHGFGSGQSTIFPNSPPCAGKESMGRGFSINGRTCYTIPELLDSQKQAEAMVDHYKNCWGRTSNGSNVAAGYVCYAGTIAPDNPIILKRISNYEKCKTNPPASAP